MCKWTSFSSSLESIVGVDSFGFYRHYVVKSIKFHRVKNVSFSSYELRRWLHGEFSALAEFYCLFQPTFQCNIPKFVVKFASSLRSSKVHFRIRKHVCKETLWLAPLNSRTNHSLCLQTGLRIPKSTFQLCNELANFTTNCGMLHWKVSWNRQ